MPVFFESKTITPQEIRRSLLPRVFAQDKSAGTVIEANQIITLLYHNATVKEYIPIAAESVLRKRKLI